MRGSGESTATATGVAAARGDVTANPVPALLTAFASEKKKAEKKKAEEKKADGAVADKDEPAGLTLYERKCKQPWRSIGPARVLGTPRALGERTP